MLGVKVVIFTGTSRRLRRSHRVRPGAFLRDGNRNNYHKVNPHNSAAPGPQAAR